MMGDKIVMDATRTLQWTKYTIQKSMNNRTKYSHCTTQELPMKRFIDSFLLSLLLLLYLHQSGNGYCYFSFIIIIPIIVTSILSKTIVVVILIIVPIIIIDNFIAHIVRKI